MILYILITAHFLADFTFQTNRLVRRKRSDYKYLICHSMIYAFTFIPAIFPFASFGKGIMVFIITTGSHFLIDWARIIADRKCKEVSGLFFTFIADQVLHILILTVTYYLFSLESAATLLYANIRQWPNFDSLVVYSLIFVLIWDPAAVLVKMLFACVIDKNRCDQEDNDPPAGRIIGKLERIIISVLILIDQFSAIGLVLTAKSIARFRQLEDRSFAEKYLVGTLTSFAFAIIISVILKHQCQ
ncbi:MAG: DUF3307 domain-containing protein [Clostridiaceae bacterium]|jgi:hypothetical protein|nr:DUF3307 domain-containing protein [Clostridiaceae bacterium]